MSDDAQIVRGNQCAVCFDHGDSSGSGRLVVAHEGCIDRLEAERDAWKRLADGMEVERLRQEVERLEAERDATQAKVEGMTLHGVEDLLRDLEAAEAERDRLREQLAEIERNAPPTPEEWHAVCAERDRLREALNDACQCAFAAMNQRAQADYGKTWQAYRDHLLAREALGGHQ